MGFEMSIFDLETRALTTAPCPFQRHIELEDSNSDQIS